LPHYDPPFVLLISCSKGYSVFYEEETFIWM
jgi:hypothetical protein